MSQTSTGPMDKTSEGIPTQPDYRKLSSLPEEREHPGSVESVDLGSHLDVKVVRLSSSDYPQQIVLDINIKRLEELKYIAEMNAEFGSGEGTK